MYEKTIEITPIFEGRILKLEVLDVELEDGTRSTREVIRHGGAVAAVARLDADQFIFVRQFRKPVERCMTEVVAGTLNPGEDPDACLRREIEEEIGHRTQRLYKLGFIYPSPGYMDEKIHIYIADVVPGETFHSQDPDERVESVTLSRDQFEGLIRNGEIHDSKTLSAWHLFTVWDGTESMHAKPRTS